MFSGIIQQLGRVVEAEERPQGRRLVVDPGAWSVRPADGDSVAVNGCCLTAVETGASPELRFDVIGQTTMVTTLGGLVAGDAVNLESPVTPQTMLSGHIVQGHVDGVGHVRRVQDREDDWRVSIEPPAALRPMILDKGSIAVDGVSLTVAALTDDGFEIALIPETRRMTTMGTLRAGDAVNLEVDYLVKAVAGVIEQMLPGMLAARRAD